MEKTYDPKSIEQRWYQAWEQNNYFTPNGKGDPYCIVIPPPNVTGSLHMGHGFQLSLIDALIRYKRMCGNNTLWQLGVDHAGIATQIIVEQNLKKEGLTRQHVGREKFLEKIWEWKQSSGNTISKQERRLGSSGDWNRERFTMDPGLAAAVHKVFISLYEEGLIYRGTRLVNWDPTLNTAISDLEVINEEQDGNLWYIRYPIVNSDDYLVIATTRPETMLGDVAVAIHPDDERYQQFIGAQVQLPLTDRIIPIITDESVLQEFGTGCVKITPAHDFNDYATAQRHNLPMINIFTNKAYLNENVPEAYRGLDRYEARQRILADLTALELLEDIQPYRINIPKGDRSGAVIEPYLTNQWFVKMKDLAAPAIEAVKKGEIKFIPDNWNKVYFQWLENIEDWCISRQLWWGHRIPAWYDKEGTIYVGNNLEEIRSKYKLAANVELTQDEDVLDTWFSSALWPFSSLGWPENTNEFKTFYPTSVLVTGFDIIFFWVARMVMMGLKFTGQVPFHEVYIHGLIRDNKGKKMSKSKGNIIDPVDLIDGIDLESFVKKRTSNLMNPSLAKAIEKNTRQEFPNGITGVGTDALRFTFCALASTGRDINFDVNRLEGYRNFCTKLWNAARYVMMQANDCDLINNSFEYSIADHWIKAQLALTIKNITEYFKDYRFDLIAQNIYDFVWREFCDWYVELCKPILTGKTINPALKNGARKTLAEVLETILRLIHPITPFISEEIWQQLCPFLKIKPTTIMLQPYPSFDSNQIDQEIINQVEWLKKVIMAIRNIRGEMNIPPQKMLKLNLRKGTEKDHNHVDNNKYYLTNLAKLESIEWAQEGEKTFSATALVDNLEISIPMESFIDKTAEIWRLNKEINKLQRDFDMLNYKLNSQEHVNKAPPELVAKEQRRLQEIHSAMQKLREKLVTIEKM